VKLVDFLMGVVPARKELSERLISYDEKSDVTVMKFSYAVEIVPICKV
jgi:nonsense-mediated mRNA decay protein 3